MSPRQRTKLPKGSLANAYNHLLPTTMQNQITNQLLLFGIQPGEYQIATHPTGEIEITVAGNAVAVIPTTGRKVIQLNQGWTLDRIPGDSLILAVSAVVAALLRCRHTERVCGVDLALPGADQTVYRLPVPATLSMVENTSPPCGGEVAIPRLGIYPTDNHSPESYE